MTARTRPGDMAALEARRMLAALCAELRSARIGAGLSLDDAAERPGCRRHSSAGSSEACSAADRRAALPGGERRWAFALSIEALRGRVAPFRDRAQLALLARFEAASGRRFGCCARCRCRSNGDTRAWDGMVDRAMTVASSSRARRTSRDVQAFERAASRAASSRDDDAEQQP